MCREGENVYTISVPKFDALRERSTVDGRSHGEQASYEPLTRANACGGRAGPQLGRPRRSGDRKPGADFTEPVSSWTTDRARSMAARLLLTLRTDRQRAIRPSARQSGRVGPTAGVMPQLRYVSFGYGHTKSRPDCALMIDARHLSNPYRNPALRDLDARVPCGAHPVSNPCSPPSSPLGTSCSPLPPRGETVTIAVGCEGGRHRAPVPSSEAAAQMDHLGELRSKPSTATLRSSCCPPARATPRRRGEGSGRSPYIGEHPSDVTVVDHGMDQLQRAAAPGVAKRAEALADAA